MDATPQHLTHLNPQQLEAVTHGTGPILILAGAGSGKTRVLTRRVVHLITEMNVAPQNIIAVTFTNKATSEMRRRISGLLSGKTEEELEEFSADNPYSATVRQPWVATFHSTALKILRRHTALLEHDTDFVVYDAQDSKNLLKDIVKQLNIDEKRYPVNLFKKQIEQAKNNLITPKKLAATAADVCETLSAEVYDHYQRRLLESNAMDFGDLLMKVVELFDAQPDLLRQYQKQFQYVLVDEFQDTNSVQYRFVQQISAPQKNLLVVGDDDQSIYAFRGATVANILDFERDFPETKVVKLEQNYRSTANILDASNAVIKRNSDRRDKKLWTDGERGALIEVFCGQTESAEADYVAGSIRNLNRDGVLFEQIAVFYRTNAQSRALEEALMTYGIPYRIYGGLKFYDRKEIKDVLAYLKFLLNSSDAQAFLRTVNNPPRGIGAKSVHAIAAAAREAGTTPLGGARIVAEDNKKVAAYVQLIDSLSADMKTCTTGELIERVIEKSGYGQKLRSLTKDVTARSRLENIEELKAIAFNMPEAELEPIDTLRAFLDRVSLSSSDELPVEESRDSRSANDAAQQPDVVSLMTLHLAKGLEFHSVFLTGMEEGLIPHYHSMNTRAEVAEERRLCYVGMTRAIKALHITRSARRALFSSGGIDESSSYFREASRFAFDIPAEYVTDDLNTFLNPQGDTEVASYQPDQRAQYLRNQAALKSKTQREGAASRSNKSVMAGNLVMTADAIADAVDHTRGLPKAELGELAPGVAIVHPTLGRGVIKSIDSNAANDPAKTKLSILFEGADAHKKVIFKFARLAIAER